MKLFIILVFCTASLNALAEAGDCEEVGGIVTCKKPTVPPGGIDLHKKGYERLQELYERAYSVEEISSSSQ